MQPNPWRAVLVRCLLVSVGASLVGWSLNVGLDRQGANTLSWMRATEGLAMMAGMVLLWNGALRFHFNRVPRAATWPWKVANSVPGLLAVVIIGSILAPMIA